jgi:hypothetical protein
MYSSLCTTATPEEDGQDGYAALTVAVLPTSSSEPIIHRDMPEKGHAGMQ